MRIMAREGKCLRLTVRNERREKGMMQSVSTRPWLQVLLRKYLTFHIT